jgi:uncharacterized protein
LPEASFALFKVLAVLLVVMAVMLLFGHGSEGHAAALTGFAQTVVGVIAGFAIGVVASLMGVAGGELLIPDPDLFVRR